MSNFLPFFVNTASRELTVCDDVVRADGEAVVGRIASFGLAVRPFEADAEAVEALHQRGGRPRTRGRLLDDAAARVTASDAPCGAARRRLHRHHSLCSLYQNSSRSRRFSVPGRSISIASHSARAA